jgi:hypothetical protein
LAVCAAPAALAQTEIPPDHNAWARFRRGAWRRVRVVNETFDAQGAVVGKSVVTMTTELRRANRNSVVLVEERSLELAGRTFGTRTAQLEEDFFGRLTSAAAKVEDRGKSVVKVDNAEIECRLLTLTTSDRIVRKTEEVYYSDQADPFVLMRVSHVVDRQTAQTVSKTTQVVEALNQQRRVIGITVAASVHRIVTEDRNGVTETQVVYSMAVPGGVVSETTTERNAEGEVLRRSTLELLAAGGKPRLFRRF